MLTDPASIAWLLNIRGGDVPFTPFALSFALVHADGATDLFIDPAKVPSETRSWLGNAVSVIDRTRMLPVLSGLTGKNVRVDPAGSPVWFAQQLAKAGASVAAGSDPCLLPKACKNDAEQHGARAAHLRDAAAVCRFLHWLSVAAPTGQETEISAAEALLAFRRQIDGFRGESFPAISGAGEHGAIIHYRVSDGSNRPIKPNEVYLIRLWCPVSGRNNGYHAHNLDRPRHAAGHRAGPGDPRDARAYRAGHINLSQGCRRRPSRRTCSARPLAGRPRLRPRHRARRRQLPVRA